MADNNLLGWDDEIESDGQEFVLLPEGDYNFRVTNFERGTFSGGQKIPACNKATITIQVTTPEGIASIRFDLLMYKTVEWKISAFFRCFGQKKSGEKMKMDWNKVIGSKGRAKIKQRTYTTQSGEERTINDIERFYDYKDEYFSAMDELIPVDNDEDLPF